MASQIENTSVPSKVQKMRKFEMDFNKFNKIIKSGLVKSC